MTRHRLTKRQATRIASVAASALFFAVVELFRRFAISTRAGFKTMLPRPLEARWLLITNVAVKMTIS